MADSESIRDRVFEFIKAIKSNPNRFQESIGVSGTYLKTVKNIGADKVAKIMDAYPQLNVDWLLTGKGEMMHGNMTYTEARDIISGTGYIISGHNNHSVNTFGDVRNNDSEDTKSELESSVVDSLSLEIENLNREVKYLKDLIHEKEKVILEKEKNNQEKERLINILIKKQESV